MRSFLICSLLAVVGLLSSVVSAADMVDNPGYQMWSKYKPGTTVVYKHVIKANEMNMTMEMTQKLTEITPEHAVVEISMVNSAMPDMAMPARKLDFPAKAEKEKIVDGKVPPGMKADAKHLANETIEADGKKYDCEVTQFSGEVQGQSVEGKSWTCKDVPGSMVKMESKGTGDRKMDMTMTLAKADIKK
jgi:hypothetical protein